MLQVRSLLSGGKQMMSGAKLKYLWEHKYSGSLPWFLYVKLCLSPKHFLVPSQGPLIGCALICQLSGSIPGGTILDFVIVGNVPVKQKFKVPFGTHVLTLPSRQTDSIKAFRAQRWKLSWRCLERSTVDTLIILEPSQSVLCLWHRRCLGQYKDRVSHFISDFPTENCWLQLPLYCCTPVPVLYCGQRPNELIFFFLVHTLGGKPAHTLCVVLPSAQQPFLLIPSGAAFTASSNSVWVFTQCAK